MSKTWDEEHWKLYQEFELDMAERGIHHDYWVDYYDDYAESKGWDEAKMNKVFLL